MEILLNKGFYKLSAIKNAIKAYDGLAEFKLDKNNKEYLITLNNINPDSKNMIKDEFFNYVLAEMKNE